MKKESLLLNLISITFFVCSLGLLLINTLPNVEAYTIYYSSYYYPYSGYYYGYYGWGWYRWDYNYHYPYGYYAYKYATPIWRYGYYTYWPGLPGYYTGCYGRYWCYSYMPFSWYPYPGYIW